MSTLTIADVLRLPVIAAGLPRVMAGESRLDNVVRWVHVTELLDPASFLEGGELVLTTLMPQPDEPALVRGYVDQLADVRAAGLVVELGRRYQDVPPDLVAACAARDLPLVVLAKGIRFIEVTQAVHALILDAQGELLRRSQHAHEIFTAMTLRGAEPTEIVTAAAELATRTTVLEDLLHHAVICAPAGGAGFNVPGVKVLDAWGRRSRATDTPDVAGVAGPEGWLVAPVELNGQRHGRLVLLPDASGAGFEPEHTMIVERATVALSLARLTGHTRWDRRAHREALLDLIDWRYRNATDARVRTEALGLPTVGHQFVAVVIDHDVDAEPADGIATELRGSGVLALVGELSARRTGVLLALAPTSPWQPVVERLGAGVAQAHGSRAIVAVGPGVPELRQVARSFREAELVADAIGPNTRPRAFHVGADVGLPELMYALRDDVYVQNYTEHQLGRLIEHDERHRGGLLAALRSYLEAAGNKSIAAKNACLSRQAFYQRLRAIERIAGCDLESGLQRTQLHVAVTILDTLADPPPRDG